MSPFMIAALPRRQWHLGVVALVAAVALGFGGAAFEALLEPHALLVWAVLSSGLVILSAYHTTVAATNSVGWKLPHLATGGAKQPAFGHAGIPALLGVAVGCGALSLDVVFTADTLSAILTPLAVGSGFVVIVMLTVAREFVRDVQSRNLRVAVWWRLAIAPLAGTAFVLAVLTNALSNAPSWTAPVLLGALVFWAACLWQVGALLTKREADGQT